MWQTMWDWLTVDANRAVLGWFGGGVVVVAGGIWAVVRFVIGGRDKPALPPSRPNVQAIDGGVAIGRDANNNTINPPPAAKPKRKGS